MNLPPIPDSIVTSPLSQQPVWTQGTPQGMTLRDWLAGLAMQAQIHHMYVGDDQTREVIAERAYAMADEMLKARGGE